MELVIWIRISVDYRNVVKKQFAIFRQNCIHYKIYYRKYIEPEFSIQISN